MSEFLASDTSLIIGVVLILIALGDYIFMRYFAPRMGKDNPQFEEGLGRLNNIAPYWIAACVVVGLYLVMQYFRSGQ